MLPLIIINLLTGIFQHNPLQIPTIWLSLTDILLLILIPIFIIVAIIIILLIRRIKAKPIPVLGPPPVAAPMGSAVQNPPVAAPMGSAVQNPPVAAPMGSAVQNPPVAAPPPLPRNACPFCQKPLPPGKIVCPYCNNKIR